MNYKLPHLAAIFFGPIFTRQGEAMAPSPHGSATAYDIKDEMILLN